MPRAKKVLRGEELHVIAINQMEPGVHVVKKKGGTSKADKDYTRKAL